MELNYWSSSVAKRAEWDEAAKEWVVAVDRNGEEVVLRPKQLVLATGMSGKPNVPRSPARTCSRASSTTPRSTPGPTPTSARRWSSIGSNNSAHDICAALWEAGADVTMVQRSSTHIVRSDTLMDIGLGELYSEKAVANGITTRKADLIFASLPYRIMHEWQIPLYEQMKERDAEFYQALEDRGFMLDWGADGSGLFMKYLRRGSGYYIDVGACDLVIDGSIKLVSGRGIERLCETGVVLDDGTELPADLVVYATGYGSMNGWAADIISQEVGGQGRQGLGPRLGHRPRIRGLGRASSATCGSRPSRGAVVPRRQPAPVAALLAVPVAAAEGADGGPADAGLRAAGGAPPELTRASRAGFPGSGGRLSAPLDQRRPRLGPARGGAAPPRQPASRARTSASKRRRAPRSSRTGRSWRRPAPAARFRPASASASAAATAASSVPETTCGTSPSVAAKSSAASPMR